MDQLVETAQTPAELFQKLLEDALPAQGLYPDPHTVFYVCRILCLYTNPHQSILRYNSLRQPLALQYRDALECEDEFERRHRIRALADHALFTAGFFPDSLKRNAEIDYVVSMGKFAYALLSTNDADVHSKVFEELAVRFISYTDALEEVCERTGYHCDTSILRLYDKWVRTGSKKAEKLLVRRGILPNRSLRRKIVSN